MGSRRRPVRLPECEATTQAQPPDHVDIGCFRYDSGVCMGLHFRQDEDGRVEEDRKEVEGINGAQEAKDG